MPAFLQRRFVCIFLVTFHHRAVAIATGVHFIQEFGYYAALARMKLQYNVYKKIFLTLRSDLGATGLTVSDVFDHSNTLFGYGLTASYNSFIGPVEFTVMGSNINPSASFFINIGFSF